MAVQEQTAALGNSAALPKHHPQAALEEKSSITASVVQKEKQRGHRSSIKIQSRSTRLSDSQTLFMGTHHPPHTARVFSTENQDLTLQRLRHVSQKQHVCYLCELGETGHSELKKTLLFLCAAPSSFPCRPVSLSLSLLFLLRLVSLECCAVQKFFLCLNIVVHLTKLFQQLTASH